MKILAINPGSTSTKIAVYEDRTPFLVRNIRHSVEELTHFPRIIDQFEFRKNLVIETLKENDIPFEFDAIVGRGGLLKPVPGGVYEVNDAMLDDIIHAMRSHACNLGCLIAAELAALLPACRAFIADPGVVDELDDIARVTGFPSISRISIWHALNQRAIARRYAAEFTEASPERPVRYEDLNLVICHLGGGISIGAHRHGRAVDVNNALDGEGPFSPERAGTLPAGLLIDICYSRLFAKDELKKHISGDAGLAAHLGTTDILAIIKSIEAGDEKAELVLNAMIYQVAKSVGAAAVVLYGKVDAILLTGGIAHSDYVISRLKERISFLAPVHVYPGEDELEALALNVLAALRGELPIQVYK
ncbi:butyrate kinase [Bacteroides sp. UBA939]|uniref:butyrate kinase n=1 Tax=Bacteroides sp. UBA939 TaxID=1946092 RepID=UPI0025B964E7|nr:butyrate kinase [Bacteroides sp. UBA939]